MAVEIFSENYGVSMSPRISFSLDFCQSDAIPHEQKTHIGSNSSGFNSSIDFDFCIIESFGEETSYVDELFSGGKILPIEIKKKTPPSEQIDQSRPFVPPPKAVHPNPPTSKSSIKESPKDSKFMPPMTLNGENEPIEKQSSKSFWSFKRSTTWGNGYRRRNFCLLPLFSRSSSIWSSANMKRVSHSKAESNNNNNSNNNITMQQNNSKRQGSTKSNSQSLGSNCYEKPAFKKGHGHRYYVNSVRINTVLNVSSTSLFCLGSIFSNFKDSNRKKKK